MRAIGHALPIGLQIC